MKRIGRLVAVAGAALALAFAAWGCGGDDGDGDGGGAEATIIRGTTDQPISFDPAGAYDLPSWDVITNVYQNVLTVPPGGNTPEGDAAQSCEFTDPRTLECAMKPGLKFSDGSPLTSEDVKFSFDRNVGIADPQGASSLLANMESVEAPDPRTVIFHLNQPDATFPFVLTMASMAIVPSDVYPRDEIQPSGQAVGSGHYTVASYQPGQQTVLEANPEYAGDDPPENERAIFQYYDKSSALKLAVEQGDVDLAYRSLTPTEIDDLRDAGGLSVVEGAGTEIRYFVFNLNLQPGNTDTQKKAIRQAAAMTVDRQSIAENVYNGTVEPLYSMVPQGLEFATRAFADRYGESPDPAGAERVLNEAGVQTPVDLELWWTPSHYGPVSGDEYAEIKRQLDASGLFNVTLRSTEWDQYSEAAFTDKYPVYQLGWFPDFPDADNYTASFYSRDSFLNIHYSTPEVQRLLSQEKASTDAETRQQALARIQEIGAEDAPVIPVWQGKQIAAVRDGVGGVEKTFDPSFLFRFWLISKE